MKKIALFVLLVLLVVSQAFAAAPRGYKSIRIKAEAAKFTAKAELQKAQVTAGNQQEMVMAGQPYKPEVFVGGVYPFEDQNGKRAEVFVAVCEKGLKSVDIFVNSKKAITLNADFVKPVGKYAGVSVVDQDMGTIGRSLLFDKRFMGEVNLKFVFHMAVKSLPVEKTITIPEVFEYVSDITKAENGVDAVVSYAVMPMFDGINLDGYAVADVTIGGILMPQSAITKHDDPEMGVWYEVTTPVTRELIKVLKDMDAVMTTISFGDKSVSSSLPYYSPYDEDYLQ